MGDILRVNDTQNKILKGILELSKEGGVSGYDLHSRNLVPISTWIDNYKKLENNFLISLLPKEKRTHKNRKRKTRVVYRYQLSPLGLFAIVNSNEKLEFPTVEKILNLFHLYVKNESKFIDLQQILRFYKNGLYEKLIQICRNVSVEYSDDGMMLIVNYKLSNNTIVNLYRYLISKRQILGLSYYGNPDFRKPIEITLEELNHNLAVTVLEVLVYQLFEQIIKSPLEVIGDRNTSAIIQFIKKNQRELSLFNNSVRELIRTFLERLVMLTYIEDTNVKDRIFFVNTLQKYN